MKQETLEQIQPYIDDYCDAKKERDELLKLGQVYHFETKSFEIKIAMETIMEVSEKKIMQILIDNNCAEIQNKKEIIE